MNPLLAQIDGALVGFIEVTSELDDKTVYSTIEKEQNPKDKLPAQRSAHIDCLYTHPLYQNRGVASALYNAVSQEVESAGYDFLTVDASRMAEPFFHSRGFKLVRRNQIYLRDQWLSNCSMRLQINKK